MKLREREYHSRFDKRHKQTGPSRAPEPGPDISRLVMKMLPWALALAAAWYILDTFFLHPNP